MSAGVLRFNFQLSTSNLLCYSSATVSPKAEEILKALSGIERVAIVRLGSIGDVIATLPFAWLLREVLPSAARIVWIAHPAPARLLEGVRAIDEVISLGRAPIPLAVHAYRRALRPAGIGAVFDLHGNLKSGVVTLLTGARVRIGFDRKDCREHWNPLFTNFKLPPLSSGNKTRRALEVGGFLGIARPEIRFGLEFDRFETERAAAVLAGLGAAGPVAVLQLGRLEDVRSWPLRNYRDLALGLRSSGRRVLVLGGPEEMESAGALREILPVEGLGLRYEAGTLTLRDVGALCQVLARDPGEDHVFVGPDSGCLHLAVACGLRTIGLHGPQDPARTAPVGPVFEALYHPQAAPCIPCGRRECFHSVKLACMESIVPEEVLRRALGESTGSPTAPPAARSSIPAPLAKRFVSRGGALQAGGLLLLAALLSLASSSRHSRGGLVSIFTATAMAALAYFLGRRIGTHRTGLLSGLFLLGMWEFLVWPLEPWAGLFGLLANAGLILYFEGEEDRGLLKASGIPLAALAAAAAFWMGGWPGLLVPAAAAVAFHAGEKSPWKLLRPKLLLSAAAALAICLGLIRILGVSSVPPLGFGGRAFGGLDPGSFLSLAFLGTLPASALLPFALFAHFKTRRYREDLGFADRRWRFPKAALAGGLLVLALFPERQAEHLLAIAPALAILIASWWERFWQRR